MPENRQEVTGGRNQKPENATTLRSSISHRGIAFASLPTMTTRRQPMPTASLLTRLWSLIPSGGSLPESVWRARHHFGLTFFHVLIIAAVAFIVAKRSKPSL